MTAKTIKQQLEDKTQEANEYLKKAQQLGQQNQQLQQQLKAAQVQVNEVKAQAFDQDVANRKALEAAQGAVNERTGVIIQIAQMLGIQPNEHGLVKVDDIAQAIQGLLPNTGFSESMSSAEPAEA